MSNSNSDHFALTPAFIPANLSIIPIAIPETLNDITPIHIFPKETNEKKITKDEKDDKLKSTSDFEWMSYLCEKKEINYVIDFLNKTDPSLVNFKSLDLQELEDVTIINVPKEFQSVAQDQYKRLLRFGGLDSNENIGFKSGALDKEHYNDKYNDFYDLEDPWINDDDEENHEKGKKDIKKMAIPTVFYKDFNAIKGSLAEFLKTSCYNDRIKLLENFDMLLEKNEKDLGIEKKKKSEKARKINEVLGGDNKTSTKKKPKKKVKPNSDVEFLNPYAAAMNNPFIQFPEPNLPNNFVVANMKFNPFIYNKNMIPTNNILTNISSGLMNEQFIDKIKSEQNLPNYLDINSMGNLGVDFLNMMFNNNGGKMPSNFPLNTAGDFQIDSLKLPNNLNKSMDDGQMKKFDKEKSIKKKKNTDIKLKNENSKGNFLNENQKYIEIIETEDSPERTKN